MPAIFGYIVKTLLAVIPRAVIALQIRLFAATKRVIAAFSVDFEPNLSDRSVDTERSLSRSVSDPSRMQLDDAVYNFIVARSSVNWKFQKIIQRLADDGCGTDLRVPIRTVPASETAQRP